MITWSGASGIANCERRRAIGVAEANSVRRCSGPGVKNMRFARWVFLFVGISGVIMVIPPYFLEERFARSQPPPVNHPELYYGFFGVTLSWQLMFLVIGSDP